MRILIFSDLHAHTHLKFSEPSPNGLNTRFWHAYTVLEQLYQYAEKEGIRRIEFVGDLFHTKQTLHVPVMTHIFNFFKKTTIETEIIPGNHDWANAEGTISSLRTLSWINPLIKVFEEPTVQIDSKGIAFCYLPFPMVNGKFSAAKFSAWMEIVLSKASGCTRRILFFHAYTNELMAKYHDCAGDIDAASFAGQFDFVFLGHHHIHDKLTFEKDGARTTVVSIGSPLQITTADAGFQRGALVFDLEAGSIEQVRFEAPRFFVFKSAKEVDKAVIPGNFIEAIVDTKAEKNRVETMLEDGGAAGFSVSVRPKLKETRMSIGTGLDDSAVLSKYVDSPWGTPSVPLDKKRLLKMGNEFLVKGGTP